jgi:selenocysteine-specific elongation factor
MKYIILGTAGHIDHGKTTLIRALTGVDCDRLKEEKIRGITIELGFTYLDIQDGVRIGIIDVPGHEKFVHHMVAGVVGMDLVMLVIGADEGIMPQTREHLDICRLLGVKKGLIAVTKTDIVDQEWLELVVEEVEQFAQGTFLDQSPVIPVSSTIGDGIENLKKALGALALDLPEHLGKGAFRLPVDRVFTMKGFGTVVTGTMLSGEVRTGDTIEILPRQIHARVRGIQVYNEKVEVARAGQRTAINLQGIEKENVGRGDLICQPGLLEPSYLLDIKLTLLENIPPLKNRSRIRFHMGTTEIFARVILLDREELRSGETCMAQLRLEEKAAGMPRDRFVIRRYSPVMTLGGGEIIDSHPIKHKRFKKDVIEDLLTLEKASIPLSIEFYLKKAGIKGMDLKALMSRTNIEQKVISQALEALKQEDKILIVDESNQRAIHITVYNEFQEKIKDILKDFHKKNPLKGGISKEELKARLSPNLDSKIYARLLEALERGGGISVKQETCSLVGHQVSLSSDEQGLYDQILKIYQDAGMTPPNQEDVLSRFRKDRDKAEKFIILLLDEGKLTRLKGDLLFHQDALKRITEQVQNFLKDGKQMGITDFKELTGLSRKFAVALLEYLDAQGVTIRVGDQRVLRKKIS